MKTYKTDIFFIIGTLLLFMVFAWHTFGYETDHHKCKCAPTPTPTPTISCTPTPVPSPTGVISPTSSPIPSPTQTPLPTPTSVPLAEESTPSNVAGGSASILPGSTTLPPAVPQCNIPFDAPILQAWSFGPVPGSLTFSWWPSTTQGIDKESLVYGYSPTLLRYGVILPPLSGSYTINGLIPGKIVWAQVWALKGGCSEKSEVLDP